MVCWKVVIFAGKLFCFQQLGVCFSADHEVTEDWLADHSPASVFLCRHYSVVRQRYFSVTPLKDLFETVNAHIILDFIKEIGFYNRI